MAGSFRFDFALGGSDETLSPTPQGGVVTSATDSPAVDVERRGTWYYAAAPDPVIPLPCAVAVPGSGFVRAFADADAVAPGGRDIVRGLYEGGAKVWECTLDVERWIATSAEALASVSGASIAVDLGCGAGLLGCAVQRGNPHARVVFQDRNTAVIKEVTWPTIQLNGGLASLRSAVLLAADWERMSADVRAGSPDVGWLRGAVDLVVSSETLYAVDAYVPLLNLLDALLAPGGVALFGSKAFYFGVGGSVAAFVDAARGVPGNPFSVEVAQTFDDGKTVTRAIVRLTRRGCQ